MNAILMNRQETGFAKTLAEANTEIATARKATPEVAWHLYRSYVRRERGGFEWGWVLK